MTPRLEIPHPAYSTKEELLTFNAITHGDRETLETLVRKGVDVGHLELAFVSVLHVAIESGHSELVPYLLSLGADVKARDVESNTPLLLAAAKGQFETMKQLVEHGAKVNATNAECYTSLHFAVSKLDTAMIAWLLEHGAHVHAMTFEAKSAVELCLRSFCKQSFVTRTYDVLRLFCSHGAKWDKAHKDGFSIEICVDDFQRFPKWRKGLCACLELWEAQQRAKETPLMEFPEEVIMEGNKAVTGYITETGRSKRKCCRTAKGGYSRSEPTHVHSQALSWWLPRPQLARPFMFKT